MPSPITSTLAKSNQTEPMPDAPSYTTNKERISKPRQTTRMPQSNTQHLRFPPEVNNGTSKPRHVHMTPGAITLWLRIYSVAKQQVLQQAVEVASCTQIPAVQVSKCSHQSTDVLFLLNKLFGKGLGMFIQIYVMLYTVNVYV